MINLKDIAVDSKTTWVDCDPVPGFSVEIAYIPRTEMSALVKSCQQSKFSRSTRQQEMTLDDDKFLDKFVKRAIKGWKGLTLEKAESLIPIDYEEKDKDAELQFSKDNAKFLVRESSIFDDWLNETISDIDTFRNQ